MHAVHYELIESYILYPGSLLQKDYKKPWGNYQYISYQSSHNSLFSTSLAPLWCSNLIKAKTYSKNCSYPCKQSGCLQKVKPGANNFIIPVVNIIVMMVVGAVDIISDPVDIQEDLLPRVDNENESHQQANEKQPVKDIFLCINLNYCWFFDDLIQRTVYWDHYHHQK